MERAKNAENDNPRWQYLHKTLRLEHDPFAGFTAERDADPNAQPEAIRKKIAEDPPFYDYFVEPSFEVIHPDEPQPIANEGLLALLLEPRPVIVIGDPGSGKTMLRYVVEHEIRVRHGYTLVVSHSLGKGPRDEDLAASLAIDLFIQTVERFRLLKTGDEALRARLWRFWQVHAPHLEKVLAKLLKDKTAAQSPTGIARWWWRLDRPVVPNTPLTPRLRRFLEDTLYALQSDRIAGERTCPLADGLELAGRLGFQQAYFLLDAAGVGRPALVAWQHVWQHLTEPLATQQIMPFYAKYFIPTHFQSDIPVKDLPPEAISVMIAWDDSALVELIANRFRSARRWMRSFDTVSDIPHLNVQMIAAAEESPRRLVQIVSALIDAHAGRAPDAPFFTVEDWQTMRQQWGGSQPPPAIETHEA